MKVPEQLVGGLAVALFGFLGIVARALYKLKTTGQWKLSQSEEAVGFFNGVLLPYGVVLFIYPVTGNSIDLSKYSWIVAYTGYWVIRFSITQIIGHIGDNANNDGDGQ